MNRFQKSVSVILTIGLLIAGAFAQSNDQINEREVANTMRQLSVKLDDFRNNLNYEINRGSVNQNDEKQINDYFKDLRNDVSDFQNNLINRSDSAEDVKKVLNSGKNVNDYVSRLRLNAMTQNDWKAVHNLLDKLALSYNITWSWKDGVWESTNQNSNGNVDNSGLTGTYQLDASRSENVKEIATQAINNSTAPNRDEALQDLEYKLESPQQLTIDLNGNQAILASTLTDQLTLSTDGTVRSETLSDGTNLSIRATMRGEELTVSTVGGNNDYTVTFTPLDNGQSLKVTRRVTTDYLSQTVFAESIFTKTDAVARFDIYGNPNTNSTNSSGNTSGNTTSNYPTNTNNYPTNTGGTTNTPRTTGTNAPTTSQGKTGQFIVPNGAIITGLLDNLITTKVSQNNDRFKIRVQGPSQFRGAVIEGYLSGINRSGKIAGRSTLTLNFETITLPNGQSYDFAGYLQSITDPQGKNIKVDSEGTAKTEDQSKTTAIRGGVGAGLGALIGVIAGGGKGAAIGAIIGGGAGAGSVYAQGNNDLEIKEGSSISIQATSPNR